MWCVIMCVPNCELGAGVGTDIVAYIVFFFKQKTAYEMRISDWSSDVCSSDLVRKSHAAGMDVLYEGLLISAEVNRAVKLHEEGLPLLTVALDTPLEIGRASCRDRVCQYV